MLRVVSYDYTTTIARHLSLIPGLCSKSTRHTAQSCRPRWRRDVSLRPLLRHRHLGFVPYPQAEQLQQEHREQILAWKALPSTAPGKSACPSPLLLSFEAAPVFTLGRRQRDLTDEQATRLRRPLEVKAPDGHPPVTRAFEPAIRKTARGGLTTYHGPGQLVLWPVLDMHSPLHAHFGVLSYAGLLQETTRRLLASMFDLETFVDRDEPGVWVAAEGTRPPRKIAALGVHHRMWVSSLGIALNLDVSVAGHEPVNPWARFVPCGLEGKAVTSVVAERPSAKPAVIVAHCWANLFEEALAPSNHRGEQEPR